MRKLFGGLTPLLLLLGVLGCRHTWEACAEKTCGADGPCAAAPAPGPAVPDAAVPVMPGASAPVLPGAGAPVMPRADAPGGVGKPAP
jgi:hypothetical protein